MEVQQALDDADGCRCSRRDRGAEVEVFRRDRTAMKNGGRSADDDEINAPCNQSA
jgi:hypothetical protein